MKLVTIVYYDDQGRLKQEMVTLTTGQIAHLMVEMGAEVTDMLNVCD